MFRVIAGFQNTLGLDLSLLNISALLRMPLDNAAISSSLDVTAWLDCFLGCLGRAFTGAEETLAAVLKKSGFLGKKSSCFDE